MSSSSGVVAQSPGDHADPTINVKEQLRAAVDHINDLRRSEDARLRSEFTAESKRVDESISAERRRVDEQMNLRAEFALLLRDAEAKRIDAIRAVDVNAVSVAAERAAAAAQVLATQVSTSADTLRSLVATTAAATQQQFDRVFTAMSDRLTVLEKSSNEGIGKGFIRDPQMDQMLVAINALTVAQSNAKGASGGMRDVGGWVFAGIMALVTIASIVWANLK